MIRKPLKIAASLMCADLLNLQRDLTILETLDIDILHLDIMDGHFVPNITLGLDTIRKVIYFSRTPKEIHLLVHNPDMFIEALPLNNEDTVIIHAESTKNLKKLIKEAKSRGVRVGIAFNPGTPFAPYQELFPFLDVVLLMTTIPGFKGQKFIEASKQRLQKLRRILQKQKLSIDIEVDGGISEERIRELHADGANVFVAGTSTIFRNTDISENIKHLYKAIAPLRAR